MLFFSCVVYTPAPRGSQRALVCDNVSCGKEVCQTGSSLRAGEYVKKCPALTGSYPCLNLEDKIYHPQCSLQLLYWKLEMLLSLKGYVTSIFSVFSLASFLSLDQLVSCLNENWRLLFCVILSSHIILKVTAAHYCGGNNTPMYPCTTRRVDP